jgi:hypothetical protein
MCPDRLNATGFLKVLSHESSGELQEGRGYGTAKKLAFNAGLEDV